MTHNAEAEACDLLMEIEQLELLEQVILVNEKFSNNKVIMQILK